MMKKKPKLTPPKILIGVVPFWTIHINRPESPTNMALPKAEQVHFSAQVSSFKGYGEVFEVDVIGVGPAKEVWEIWRDLEVRNGFQSKMQGGFVIVGSGREIHTVVSV